MSIDQLAETAQAMVAAGKGIIAIDESTNTIAKRFQGVGVENTEENRRAYREMLLTAPKLGEHISGAILYDETIRQATKAGVPFTKIMRDAGILPGIKVDLGAKPLAGFPGELVTEGLDGLRERLAEYAKLGAKFAKWRAVISIGDDTPSGTCIEANSHALARYAALCQEAGIVPIVEPEVLMDGDHDLDVCYEVTEATLRSLFGALYEQNVMLEGTILKALRCLKAAVPASLPGVVFLSGGQSDEQATAHLNAMNQMGPHPWPLSFSYGRAMQSAALQLWGSDMQANFAAAQAMVHQRAKQNGLAALGQWKKGA